MIEEYCIDGIVREDKYVDPEIVNSPHGYKMIVPIFNSTVPAYYQDFALKVTSIFMVAYSSMRGETVEAKDIYLDGHLGVYLDRKIALDKKYRLFITVIIGQGTSAESEDYIIEIPIAPADAHFREFRQCFLDTFEAMIGSG